jgi:hypothetical protein
MLITNLFSKRMKAVRNEGPDVYQHSVEFLPYAKALLLCLEKKI